MSKHLDEMSMEELRQLFPVILTDHKEEWETWYGEEKANLEHILLSETVERISHVGSTVIGKIKSKPIVDILIEVTPGTDMGELGLLPGHGGYKADGHGKYLYASE